MSLTPLPATAPVIALPVRTPSRPSPPVVLAIMLAFLAPFLLYFDTVRSMVAVWNSSETFAHGYIILPISLWLIWQRRDQVRAFPLQPCWPALLLLGVLGFGWLLARMGEVQVVKQYAFVSMIPVVALAIFGRQRAAALAFPLLFLLLAVPFGEIFIAPLIGFTADFTVWALQTTGIPVLRNGSRFEIPSGSWSVVEACSGVRYLISSVTLGCLYAYLTYRSAVRRALFMVCAVVVPIVANGMRAYLIVMIGHLSGMTLAVGIDHILYGWLFFGLVMFILFWCGNYWRQDGATVLLPGSAPSSAPPALARRAPRASSAAVMALAIVLTMALWPLYGRYSDRFNAHDTPRLPRVAIAWPPAPAFSSWVPRFTPEDARYQGTFRPPAATAQVPVAPPVALSILYYRNQHHGKAAISSSNHLTGEKDEAHQLGSHILQVPLAARPLAVRETTVQTATRSLLVWQWYWAGHQFTANDYAGKLLQAKDKLLLRGDDGAVLLLVAPYDGNPEQARASLRAFLNENLTAMDAALLQTQGT